MAWIQKEPVAHECVLPRPAALNGVGIGSVWQCDNCPKRWVYVAHPDGMFREQENVG